MAKRSTTERAPVTREVISSVAAELIKDQGLEALTMRTVAARLGVSAMALYHHVVDKDEIIRLVGDDMLAKIKLPDPESGDWRQLITDAVNETHSSLLQVPGMASVMLTRTLLPNARRILLFCIRQFERAGLTKEQALTAYAGLHQLSVGRLMVETSSNFDVHTHLDAEDELLGYMNALHSHTSFDEALAGLLDHYTPSADHSAPSAPARRTSPARKAAAKPRKAAVKQAR